MAGAMVGGAFLGALFNVVLDRIDSPPVLNFIRGKKLLVQLLERLKTTLTVVRAVLNDAEKKQFSDPHVNKWLNELKHAVYMADDLLDEVATKAAVAAAEPQKKVTTSSFFSGLFNTARDGGMANRLKEIVDKLELILKLKKSLDLKETAMENVSSRVSSTSVPDINIYGRDEDKKAIIKLLLDDNNNNEGEQVYVIPIVGMGGVGKTTLAQMVYSDDDVKQNFNSDSRAWVCVSEEFDIMRVTKALSEELIPEEASKLTTLNSLQEKLAEKLTRKKFLIVLDDVWIEDYHNWSLLKKPLQYGARGSKILVTTRTEKVASLVQAVRPYCLSQLSYEDNWLVFAYHACLSLGSGENTTSLEKIGMEIVKKCGGLPLAAQSLGGSLRTTRDIRDWNNVRNSDIWELPESENKIIPSLRISYHYLPSHLKRCFVYCSLYPKDYEFEKNEVILLWMAEGLLPAPKKGKTLEEVGDECFDYLVSCTFFQHSSPTLQNNERFGMHDLMHDLATFLGEEFYFRSDDLGVETTLGSKTRHLSFKNFSSPNSEIFGVLSNTKFLRTLFRIPDAFTSPGIDHEVTCIEVLSLEYFRVLSFCFLENLIALPDSIGGLIHLRYLDLSWTRIKLLPESLCSLYNLQTLKLLGCRELTILPSGMQKLVNLHYLDISGTGIKEEMPKGMSKLNKLQHLPYFIVGKHEGIKINELGGFPNLHGSFEIRKLENVANSSEALEARMMDKKHIQRLDLHWSSTESCMDSQTEMDILCKLEPHQDLQSLIIRGYRGTRYPDWVGKPCYHNMTMITLYGCSNCFTLPSLGQLPSLRDLFIYSWKSLETVDGSFFNKNDNINDGNGSLLTVVPFPSLESLQFQNMPYWEVWSCSEQLGVFPKLKRLVILNCPTLKGDLPSDLPALEQLEIRDCPKLKGDLPSDLPALKQLVIRDCPKLKGDLPSDLPALKQLVIRDCPKLKGDLPSDLPALKQLEITDCEELTCSDLLRAPALRKIRILGANEVMESVFPEQGMPRGCLTEIVISYCKKVVSGLASMDMLTKVAIYGCPDDGIKSFPNINEGLLLPPSLKELYLSKFSSLETLDCKGLLHLTHLQRLELWDCPKLENMEGESLPASLSTLAISGCPLVGEQCRTKHPHIWPKISHIQYIYVDRKVIS